MADAVFWDILTEVQSLIKSSLTFTTQTGDDVQPPKDAAVVIRKVPWRDQDEKHDRSEATPGIVISPRGATTNPMDGTNERDDTKYFVWVQLLVEDPSFHEEELRSYLKWQEQIRKFFQSTNLANVQAEAGYVQFVNTIRQIPVDPKIFPFSKYTVGVLELQFISRENRGVTT